MKVQRRYRSAVAAGVTQSGDGRYSQYERTHTVCMKKVAVLFQSASRPERCSSSTIKVIRTSVQVMEKDSIHVPAGTAAQDLRTANYQ